MTLGKGTTGPAPTPSVPTAALYTSQAQTGLPNNGYGAIAGGTRPADADNDGMPDSWERATGSNPGADDAMTKAADGYTLHRALRELAGRAARDVDRGRARSDVDLSALHAAASARVSPTFIVSGARRTAPSTLQADGHTARFQPAAGFHGRRRRSRSR